MLLLWDKIDNILIINIFKSTCFIVLVCVCHFYLTLVQFLHLRCYYITEGWLEWQKQMQNRCWIISKLLTKKRKNYGFLNLIETFFSSIFKIVMFWLEGGWTHGWTQQNLIFVLGVAQFSIFGKTEFPHNILWVR